MAKIGESRVYQIKVTLDGIKPPIWRRLLVPGSVSLRKLHDLLQVALGWTDSHLHAFEVRGESYGIPDPDFPEEGKTDTRVHLDQVFRREKDAIVYEYDFGDGWTHKIVLEKILPVDPKVAAPRCTGGARACPPEDCGGVWGYADFLRVIGDPSDPEHEEMIQWVGEEFDPERFDLDAVNAALAPRKRRA